jgi:hypothetical protein
MFRGKRNEISGRKRKALDVKGKRERKDANQVGRVEGRGRGDILNTVSHLF